MQMQCLQHGTVTAALQYLRSASSIQSSCAQQLVSDALAGTDTSFASLQGQQAGRGVIRKTSEVAALRRPALMEAFCGRDCVSEVPLLSVGGPRSLPAMIGRRAYVTERSVRRPCSPVVTDGCTRTRPPALLKEGAHPEVDLRVCELN